MKGFTDMNKGEKKAYIILLSTIAIVLLLALAGVTSVFRNGAGSGYNVYTPAIMCLVFGGPIILVEFIVYMIMRKKKK